MNKKLHEPNMFCMARETVALDNPGQPCCEVIVLMSEAPASMHVSILVLPDYKLVQEQVDEWVDGWIFLGYVLLELSIKPLSALILWSTLS